MELKYIFVKIAKIIYLDYGANDMGSIPDLNAWSVARFITKYNCEPKYILENGSKLRLFSKSLNFYKNFLRLT